jgi:hypothetical protein
MDACGIYRAMRDRGKQNCFVLHDEQLIAGGAPRYARRVLSREPLTNPRRERYAPIRAAYRRPGFEVSFVAVHTARARSERADFADRARMIIVRDGPSS